MPVSSSPSLRLRGLGARDVLCVAGLMLLLVSAYFISKNTSGKLMIAGLGIIAASGATFPLERLPRPLLWGLAVLAAFAAWAALGLIAGRAAPGPAGEALASFGLLALTLLAGRRLLACCGLRPVLMALLAVAGASAAATLVLHFAAGLSVMDRLVPLGRPGNAIPGAGGLCVALIGAIVLLRDGPRPVSSRMRALVAAAVPPIVLVVAMTQSRGPIFAALVTVAVMLLPWRATGWRLFLMAMSAWALTTALIVLDPWLRSLVCVDTSNFCRPSARLQIWTSVADLVTQRPVFGLTPIFRFDDPVLVHAHNGLFGTAMFFGVPALIALLVATFAYCRHLESIDGRLAAFCGSALIFSFGYMGSDLPNPFAFANMHYFFLWLPVAFGLSWRPGEPSARAG